MIEEVNHPAHYGGDTTYEVIKVIEAWKLGFHLGNTVKYVARAGKKGDLLTDLRKAKFYLDRKIKMMEEECQVENTTPKSLNPEERVSQRPPLDPAQRYLLEKSLELPRSPKPSNTESL